MKKITKHPLHRRWTQIKFMITNENARQHQYYRDIEMVGFDDFWAFVEFVEREIGPLPDPSYRLARKNQRAGYVAGNLYWAQTHVEIGQRFTDIHRFRVGRKMMTFRQMAEASGIEECTIRSRIARGWTAKDAMTVPPLLGQKIYGSL
jgi:hypothetical protein